jgi:hypothetical protein
LLLLASLEWVACKAQLQTLLAEKISLEERCRTQHMLRDSVHATLLEESKDLSTLAAEELQRESSSSLSHAPPLAEEADPCSPIVPHLLPSLKEAPGKSHP